MEIILREPRSLIGEGYRIKVTDTDEEYFGTNIGFYVWDHIILYKYRKQIIEANRRFRPFGKRYFRINYNELSGHFRQLTWFKPSYEMTLGESTYQIIQHWGKKVSIFQDSLQIASIVQLNDISFNNNDTYQLLVNDNVDYIPLILAVMILDAPGNESSSNNLFAIDLGNVIGEKLPFNEKWRPKTA